MFRKLLELPPEVLSHILEFVGDGVVIINGKTYVFVNCKK